jgi:predicted RNA-binding protein with PIN domain
MTLWIVDGMNVIGSRPQTRWWRDREQAMRDLVSELERIEHDEPMLVVFDGYTVSDLESETIEMAFAERRGPHGADDKIVELLKAHEAPESVVVVTSDAALRRRITARGVTVEGASSLLRLLED